MTPEHAATRGLAVLLLLCTGAASRGAQAAQEAGAADRLAPDVAACAQLVAPDARLACYDEAAIVAGLREEQASAVEQQPAPLTRISRRWELEDVTRRGRLALVTHRPNYLLPVTWNFTPNQRPFPPSELDVRNEEVKLQLSFKLKLLDNLVGENGDLWATYTQRSFWQAYGRSSPFRDTSYEPTLMFAWRSNFDVLGWRARLLGVELNHQSNGRGDAEALSRSWNRLVANAVFERGDFVTELRAWWRIPEPVADDNNPDIGRYLGNGEVLVSWKRDDTTVSLMLRGAVDASRPRGAAELSWSFPLGSAPALKGYVQVFQGYGESLIDYDRVSRRIGVGILFSDWY